MTVSALATPHTLSFPGYTTATAAFRGATSADEIIFRIGSYSGNTFTEGSSITAQSISITGTTTIQDVASQINSLSGMGLSASVLKTADNNFSLVVKSGLGANNHISMKTEDSGNTEIAALSYTHPTNHAAKQVVAGADASFTLDGITVTRPQNKITDLIPGVTLELKNTSSVSGGWCGI